MRHDDTAGDLTPIAPEQQTGRQYVESPAGWVRGQVRAIEAAGDTSAAHIQGRPVVLVDILGARSGLWRRVPLMRVEHDGSYAAVASKGGAPDHPQWYHSLRKNPDVDVQDGRVSRPMRARLLTGTERVAWWERCVAAFPDYAEYAVRAGDREIPVFVLEPPGPEAGDPAREGPR